MLPSAEGCSSDLLAEELSLFYCESAGSSVRIRNRAKPPSTGMLATQKRAIDVAVVKAFARLFNLFQFFNLDGTVIVCPASRGRFWRIRFRVAAVFIEDERQPPHFRFNTVRDSSNLRNYD